MARGGYRGAGCPSVRHTRAKPPDATGDDSIPRARSPGTRAGPGPGARLPADHPLLLSGEALSVDAGPGQSAGDAGQSAGVFPAPPIPGPADSGIAVRPCAPAATGVPTTSTSLLARPASPEPAPGVLRGSARSRDL